MSSFSSLVQPLLLIQLSLVAADQGAEAYDARRLSSWSHLLHRHRARLPESVNLEYPLEGKAGSPTVWINSVLPEQAGSDTYYSVQSHALGYSGLQQVPWFWGYQGTVLFSIRDVGCDGVPHGEVCPEALLAKVHECGERSVCDRDMAGSGAYSRMTFRSSMGESSYGFATVVELHSPSSLLYSGYFHASEIGGWNLLSKIEVPLLSGSQFLADLHSFLEGFSCDEDLNAERSAFYGPSFVYSEGSWRQLTSAIARNLTPENKTIVPWALLGDDKKLWRIGVGSTLASDTKQKSKVSGTKALEVQRMAQLPEMLSDFQNLRSSGSLPHGCPGGTCALSVANTWLCDHLLLVSFVLMPAAVALCWWCTSRVQPEHFKRQRLAHPLNFFKP